MISSLDSSSRVLARPSTRLSSAESLRLRARRWASLSERERLRAWLYGEAVDGDTDTARMTRKESLSAGGAMGKHFLTFRRRHLRNRTWDTTANISSAAYCVEFVAVNQYWPTHAD